MKIANFEFKRVYHKSLMRSNEKVRLGFDRKDSELKVLFVGRQMSTNVEHHRNTR